MDPQYWAEAGMAQEYERWLDELEKANEDLRRIEEDQRERQGREEGESLLPVVGVGRGYPPASRSYGDLDLLGAESMGGYVDGLLHRHG